MNNLQKQLLTLVRKGDVKAGTAILENFVDTVFSGQEIDGNLLQYMAHCISDILDGEDPKIALNLKKPAVSPSVDPDELIEIAVSIELYVRLYKASKVDAPVQLAIETVAEAVGKSYDTVHGIRDKYGELANQIADIKTSQKAHRKMRK